MEKNLQKIGFDKAEAQYFSRFYMQLEDSDKELLNRTGLEFSNGGGARGFIETLPPKIEPLAEKYNVNVKSIYLLFLVSNFDLMKKKYLEKGVSEEIFYETLKDLKFERAYSRLEIYSANLDGAAIELHVSKYLYDENYSFDKLADKIKLIKPVPKTSRSNINLFKIPEELFRVQELIEHGEHLEKKYISDEPQRFSNEFWLNFYETIRELKKLFRVKKYFAEENFFKTMMISERGEIFLFADCLSKSVFKETSSRKLFETIESYFSFLGKIRCDDKILPIFKCPKYSAGQIISFDGRTFGRVLYNPKMNAYGLKNLSGKIWLAKDKQVQPNQNLVLMENYVIETDSKLYAIELFMTE